MMLQPSKFIVLDTLMNYLDIPSMEMLEEALQSFFKHTENYNI